MKTFTINTHEGVDLTGEKWTLVKTIDHSDSQTFTPCIIFNESERTNIYYELPPQPYVNDTWNDEDVQVAILNHIKQLKNND